jgi:hypothetical protein
MFKRAIDRALRAIDAEVHLGPKAQVLKTEFLINVASHYVAQDPAARPPHLGLGRLLAIGDGFIDGAAHDAGLSEFGVAEFAGFRDLRPVHAKVFSGWYAEAVVVFNGFCPAT